MFNVSNALNHSEIRFDIWGPLLEIVSVPNFTVNLCEDSSSQKFLRS